MSVLDACLAAIGRNLRHLSGTVSAPPAGVAARRQSPAASQPEAALDERERQRAAALMRVNHCGEVCAQALYEGQSATARDDTVRRSLAAAAGEEEDHLAWCRERLDELNDRPSRLTPAFYLASYALGAATGVLGDRISLGFVAATEDQVRHHLDRHLDALPTADAKSRAILEAMRADEIRHGENAARAGGARYPQAIKTLMRHASKVMTATTYRI